LTVELSPIEVRVAGLKALREPVEVSPGGEAMLRGTAVRVYEIAGLARGETIEEIHEWISKATPLIRLGPRRVDQGGEAPRLACFTRSP
jgi:hypothetical protein